MYAMPGSTILSYGGKSPQLGAGTFLAAGAHVIGDLVAGDDCSFWFNTVVRADCNYIRIGHRTNIQDGTVIHVTYKTGPTFIGNEVTIGHNATIHACTIKDRVLIGMNATLLDGVTISANSYVGAGSVVPPGKSFPEGVLILGSPARVVRDLTKSELEYLEVSANNYLMYKEGYLPK